MSFHTRPPIPSTRRQRISSKKWSTTGNTQPLSFMTRSLWTEAGSLHNIARQEEMGGAKRNLDAERQQRVGKGLVVKQSRLW
ncbi:hypothetical protein ARTHRO9AX_10343 [Arthrobacter sp. 9AX]|nr:hypothetical protein ARTHRO9AX_10343 [Arthrobacter sp. 9AX]